MSPDFLIHLVKNVLTQIIEHGRVIRGWLGVEARDLTPQQQLALHLVQGGALITGIFRSSPADLAGIQPGDILTHINNSAIHDSRALLLTTARIAPGTTVTVQGIRDNQPFQTQATLIQRASRL